MSKCYRCGKAIDTSGSPNECSECKSKVIRISGESKEKVKDPAIFGNYGWVCPVCGRGNSPYTLSCPCQPLENKVTC